MTTPTGPIVDISLNAPKATFAIALDETEIPYKLDYPEIAKWALGLRATDPYAEFSSEAWFAESIGDEFYLYCNDKLVSKGSITTKATRYFLKVLLNDLPEGLVNVYWEVERRTGQKSRSTTETYLVMKTHPAGIDRRPDIFGHDGLRVVAEGFSAESDIDENTAARGMWALVDKYLNARENDEIFVYLDGVPTKHRLSATEARGAGPYRVFIPPTVFKKISQSGPIALICTVLDVAGNTPEGNDKFSPPFMLNSNADPLLFDPPLLYVKDIESIVFDLGTQSNLPLSVLATPRRTVGFPSPPNQIVVTLTWFRPDGTTIRASKSLPPFAHTQRAGDKTPVPDDYFQEEGFVRMSFVLLTPTGVLLGRSGSSTVRVGGTRVLTYPAPAFDNKPGPQTITLQNYANGADVTVAYRSITTADVIRLTSTTPNGTVVTLGLKSGINGGTVIFRIDAQTLAQSAGQVIKLSYEVTVGGKTTKSDVQEVTVGALYAVENFEDAPMQKVGTVGVPIATRLLRFKLTQKRDTADYISIDTPTPSYFKPHIYNKVMLCYLGGHPLGTNPIRYEIEVINGTSQRISFWLAGGNITIPNPSFTIYYLNAAGTPLGSKTLAQTNTYFIHNETLVDSGFIGEIKTISIIANTQFLLDQFIIY